MFIPSIDQKIKKNIFPKINRYIEIKDSKGRLGNGDVDTYGVSQPVE